MTHKLKSAPQKSKTLINDPFSQPSEKHPTEDRIQAWKSKKSKERADLIFSTTQDKENKKRFRLEHELTNQTGSQTHPINDVVASSYAALSGSGNEEYSRLFISQAAGAMINDSDTTDDNRSLAINAFQGGMLSMEPKDIIESQLCAKLMILHAKAMFFMNSATHQTHRKHIDNNLNNATKCMRLHNETLEALNRYKRKGEQRVKVVHQYVQVNEGGQAVVANEFTRGGGNTKKVRV